VGQWVKQLMSSITHHNVEFGTPQCARLRPHYHDDVAACIAVLRIELIGLACIKECDQDGGEPVREPIGAGLRSGSDQIASRHEPVLIRSLESQTGSPVRNLFSTSTWTRYRVPLDGSFCCSRLCSLVTACSALLSTDLCVRIVAGSIEHAHQFNALDTIAHSKPLPLERVASLILNPLVE
jgi:hypothetical protein